MKDELKIRILKVLAMGWIDKSEYKAINAGILLEHLIGKPIDTFEIPDWGNIEIKCKANNFSEFILLFCATPDSTLFVIKNIQKTYGYPDKDIPNTKVFNTSVYGDVYQRKGNKYFKLHVDDKNKRVMVKVCLKNLTIVDNTISWSFDLLQEKLERKLKYLLFVKAERKVVNRNLFIRYNKATLYELRSFNHFISAIKRGYIRVTFKIGVFKGTYRYGQIYDRGTSFDINEKHIDKVFKVMEVWELGENKKT